MTGVNPRATVQFALVKTGPLKDSVSTGHGNRVLRGAHVLGHLRALPRVPQRRRASRC